MSFPEDPMVNAEAKPQKNSTFPAKHELPTVRRKLQKFPFLKSQRLFKGAQITLRLVALAATFTAMLLMLTSQQSDVILGIKFDARYSYSPAFKFFVFANAVAFFFILISLFPAIIYCRRGTCSSSCHYLLFLNDMVMLMVVIAGCAAATAIGEVGKNGNPHTGWVPICDHFMKFCSRVTFSLIFSYVSVVFLLILTAMSAINSKEIIA